MFSVGNQAYRIDALAGVFASLTASNATIFLTFNFIFSPFVFMSLLSTSTWVLSSASFPYLIWMSRSQTHFYFLVISSIIFHVVVIIIVMSAQAVKLKMMIMMGYYCYYHSVLLIYIPAFRNAFDYAITINIFSFFGKCDYLLRRVRFRSIDYFSRC